MQASTNLPVADPIGLSSTVDELLRSTTRQVMLGTDTFFLASLIIVAGNSTVDVMGKLLAAATFLVITSALAYRNLDRRYLAAQAVWYAGLIACLTIAMWLLHQPELVLLYAMLPLIAVITAGWRAAIATGILTGVMVVWLPQATGMPAIPAVYTGLVLIMSAFAGVLN